MVTFWMLKINSYSARMFSEIVWPLMKADWTLSTKELIRLSLEAKMLYVDDFERSVDETNWEQVSNLISTILLRNEDNISLVDAFQVRIPWEEIVVGTEHIILGNVKVFLKKRKLEGIGPWCLICTQVKSRSFNFLHRKRGFQRTKFNLRFEVEEMYPISKQPEASLRSKEQTKVILEGHPYLTNPFNPTTHWNDVTNMIWGFLIAWPLFFIYITKWP